MSKLNVIYFKLKKTLPLFYVLLLMAACNSEVGNQLEPKGAALGKMNEIVIISDNDVWEGAVGDTFRYYFESAYPIMPQPEPLFDLRHFTPEELQEQPLRKELRTYTILANLTDDNSATTRMVKYDLGSDKYEDAMANNETFSSVGKDKWARGQVLIYLYGKDEKKLSQAITKAFPAIAKRVNKHDEKQLKASIYVDRINLGISKNIKQQFSLDIDIPGDFVTVPHKVDKGVLWLRKDTDKAIFNIVIQRVPYQDQSQLSKEGIITLRNKFGKEFVNAEDPEDIMVVDVNNLPVYEYPFTMQDNYGKELRGIWEMTNSFSAGPFNTYLILDESKNELVYLDVFVLAPGSSKRNLMMQLDYIIKNAQLVN